MREQLRGLTRPAGSNTTSLARTNPSTDTDTDHNAADFAAGAPTPQNAAGGGSGGGDCSGYTGTGTRIRAIQGAAHVSPKNGQAVTNVRGVVTASSFRTVPSQ
jgi:predicted extracellular nuclease